MKVSNGRLILSPGEKLPESLAGRYEEIHTGTWRIKFLPCVFHEEASKVLPCGAIIQDEYCSLKKRFIGPKCCKNCQERIDGS